jgi:hypothetical protein
MAERTSDTSLIARCITYLGLIMRQMGRVEETAHFVARGLDIAEAAGMPEYTALAHANAAWVAWHKGDWAGVRAHGRAAVDIWSQFPLGHASTVARWTALMPLLALCMREGDAAGALAHAQTLLDPHMHKLPDDLTQCLETAVAAGQAGQAGQAGEVIPVIKRVLALAETHHYL